MMGMTFTIDFDPIVMCFTITGSVIALFGMKWWKEKK